MTALRCQVAILVGERATAADLCSPSVHSIHPPAASTQRSKCSLKTFTVFPRNFTVQVPSVATSFAERADDTGCDTATTTYNRPRDLNRRIYSPSRPATRITQHGHGYDGSPPRNCLPLIATIRPNFLHTSDTHALPQHVRFPRPVAPISCARRRFASPPQQGSCLGPFQ